MKAFGLTIDSWTKAASAILSVFASIAGFVSRFGPIVPVAPAALNVWQAPQPWAAKTVLPCAALPPAAAAAVVVAAAVVAAAVVAVAVVVAWAAVLVVCGAAATVTVFVVPFPV